jgi:hypothetical protein
MTYTQQQLDGSDSFLRSTATRTVPLENGEYSITVSGDGFFGLYKSDQLIGFTKIVDDTIAGASYGLCGIFDMYYNSWKACWKTQDPPIPKEHVPPPISSHITGTLNPVFGDGVFRFVKITTQPKDDYFYDLTGIKEVKFKIVLED